MKLRTLHKRRKRREQWLHNLMRALKNVGAQLVDDFRNFDKLPIEQQRAYFEAISKAFSRAPMEK